jgi:tetratricopeptide (TPR) repeat protein
MDASDDPTMPRTDSIPTVPEGKLLNRYRIEGELGRGAMGAVYRCFDEVAGVLVALKDIPPELSRNPDEMEEVRRNFQLICHLTHPHIAQIRTLEQDSASGTVYLVMDLVEGVNLRAWFNHKPTPAETLIPVIKQIALALDYAHSEKIVHRDIKPTNIMVTREGKAKVLDFGLAAQLHTSMSRLTGIEYGTSGTLPYMSPEQWRGQFQDGATDQYALGVIFYELLVGRYPFDVFDAMVLREAVLHEPPQSAAEIPPGIWPVVEKSLAKNPADRYPTCTAFAEALEAGLGATRSGGNAVLKVGLVIMSMVVIGLTGMGLWKAGFIGGGGPERPPPPVVVLPTDKGPDASPPVIPIEPQPPVPAVVEVKPPPSTVPIDGPPSIELGPEGAAVPKGPSEDLAGLQERSKRAYRSLGEIDKGQGFGKKITQLGDALARGEKAFNAAAWKQSEASFEAVLAGVRALLEQDGERRTVDALRRVIEKRKPTYAETALTRNLFVKGMTAFETGEFAEAQRFWESLADRYDQLPTMEAEQLAAKKRAETEEAKMKADALRATATAEKAREAELVAIQDLVNQGLFDAAEAKVKAYIVANEESEKTRHLKGLIYSEKKGWQQMAVREFQEAIKLNPRSLDSRLALADLYIDQNEPRDAEKMLETVLKLDPGNEAAKRKLRQLPPPKRPPHKPPPPRKPKIF